MQNKTNPVSKTAEYSAKIRTVNETIISLTVSVTN